MTASTTGVTASQLRGVLEGARDQFDRIACGSIDRATKPDGSIVTRMDIALNEWLRHSLETLLPQAAWLSEESELDPERLYREWSWVVDPLDGTKEFARGISECAISIGLVQHGVVRAGAVLNPYSGLGAAAGTDGSWANWPADLPATDQACCTLANASASVSRTEVEDGSILPFLDLVGETRPVGSVAYKLLRVACGVDDLTFSVQPKSEWDICGGVALLRARGQSIARFDGMDVRFNQISPRILGGFAAGGAELVDRMVAAVQSRRRVSEW